MVVGKNHAGDTTRYSFLTTPAQPVKSISKLFAASDAHLTSAKRRWKEILKVDKTQAQVKNNNKGDTI